MTDKTGRNDDDGNRDLTNRSESAMHRVIPTETSEAESTTSETTHEQTPVAPQGSGRHRTGVVRRIIVILLLIAPVAAAIPRLAP
jgi:hypothetical protein